MDKTMPAQAFRWEDLASDHPSPLLRRRRIVGEKMMISEVLLEEGFSVKTHAHENEQFACVIRGRLRFGIGTPGSPEHREMIVASGEVLHLPSNVPHSAQALEQTLVLDLFSPPSEATGVDATS